MTPVQLDLARHALGLPNRHRQTYRNHYVVGEGCEDHSQWTAMVAEGLATTRKGSVLTGGDDLFWLTKVGAEAALMRGERLDREDFPSLQNQET